MTVLAVIVSVCFVEVLLRDLAGRSLGWYDELVGYLLVGLTFVGAAMAQQQDRHIGIDLLSQRLGPRLNRARRFAVQAVLMIVQLLIVVFGSQLAMLSAGESAITLPVSMGLVYAILPVAALLAVFVHVVQLARIWRGGAGHAAGGSSGPAGPSGAGGSGVAGAVGASGVAGASGAAGVAGASASST